MAVLTRITDFIPNTLIESQEVDDEFDQLVNLLSGVSTNKDTLLRYSNATDAVLRVDQLGAGLIQQWLQNGSVKAGIKGNGQIIGVPKSLAINVTTVGNITTGLDALQSVSAPADSLSANNDYLDVLQSGSYAATATSKRLVLTIDGQTIHDTGLIAIGNGGAGAEWAIATRIIRISATTVRAVTQFNVGNIQTIQAATAVVATAGSTKVAREPLLTVSNLNSNAVAILLSAEGTNTDDIVQHTTTMTLTQLT